MKTKRFLSPPALRSNGLFADVTDNLFSDWLVKSSGALAALFKFPDALRIKTHGES